MDKKTMNMREAAEALEVSTDTIRRRIKAGQLRAEKIQGAYGPEWRIDTNSLAEASYNMEVVPVKHNLSPDKLEDLITRAAHEAAEAGTTKAMEEYKDTMQELTEAIKGLKNEVEELRQERERLTLWEKIKRKL